MNPATPAPRILPLGDIWPTLPGELRDRYLRTDNDDELDEEDLAYFLEGTCLCFEGDTTLTDQQWQALRNAQETTPLLVVIGDLTFAGDPPECVVTGDLACDGFFHHSDSNRLVGGKISARHYAAFFGGDDETLHRGFQGTLDTPLAFFWFHDWRDIRLPDDCVVSFVCDGHHFEEPDPAAWFYWSEDLLALRPELCYSPGCWSSDEPHWNFAAIRKTLEAGESLFVDGFDPACLPLVRQAADHFRQRQFKEAFLASKAALELSPGYMRPWRDAGLALYRADALEQAIPYLERAAALMPERYPTLQNEAVDDLALCALRLGDLERTIDLTSSSLERITHDRDKRLKAVLYRVRGEARLRRSELEPAREDLAKAADLHWNSAFYLWLAGLACHKLGDAKGAKQYRGQAARLDAQYDRDFAGHAGSDFRYNPPGRVDWEALTLADLQTEPQDADYWRRYLQHKAYDNRKSFRAIPAEFLTRDFCLEAIELCPGRQGHGDIWVAEFFPEAVFDREIAERLIDCSAANLRHLPPRLVDKALLLRADQGSYDPALIPAQLLDAELCRHLVERQVPPDALPEPWLDHALCLHAVRHWSNAIEHVPGRFRDETFYLTALAHADSAWFIENRIPARYLEPRMLCRALDIHFGLIQQLPGRLVDETVFAHAHALCPDEALWARLTAEHGPRFRHHRTSARCAEHCWAVFWDEALMLAEIDNPDYHLSPYEIPAEKYTQKIADTAFKRDPIHLSSIPRPFITPVMAERFAGQYADMLHDVPLALRSERVCALAARHSWDEGKYFRHVPLRWRGVEACIQALKHSPDNADFIPREHLHAVFDRLIERHDGEFALGWLYCQRGLGALVGGNLEAALADFDHVLGAPQPARPSGLLGSLFGRRPAQTADFDDEDREEARFYKAWALLRHGRPADELLARLDEEQRANLEHFEIAEPTEPCDFDQEGFERRLEAAAQLGRNGDYRSAHDLAREAEALLREAGHGDHHLWAGVLDQLRFFTGELGEHEENQRLCREILEHLGGVRDWPYLERDNLIRAARRAAHNTLAWRLADSPGADDLAQAVEHARATLRFAPIEGEQAILPFYETAARVLLRAAQADPARADEARRYLARIREHGLVDRGLVTDAEVLAALEREA
ncbi:MULTISPECIES: hypothetical protein [unclassified Pseudomonas]|uniref:tetratricopeptide repeat protein n=1 Tax=unclassified Pseudomonas TaxID=196821 RepID=UPI00244838DC|nr:MULTISPECIES: hypothetical protein [unclassified Pseudomonas]MDH0895750.1 hypothetical protein [Pseudomonas sp. GD03875]MDH1066602.1 hypothetical protein [Pseudomonas sp. GD03985]